MAQRCDTMRLYTAQSQAVLDALDREGVCFSRAAYVARKYGESAGVFLTAYQWFAEAAEAILPKPPGAELPYWAFRDLYSVEAAGARVLVLEVPMDQVVLFDLYDWNKVLCMKYLGESEAEEAAFRRELTLRGLRESDVMLSGFYPELKAKILGSWPRLFRHHEALRAGDDSGVGGVQAALWQIRREWIKETR